MTDHARPRHDADIRKLAFAANGTVPNHPDLPVLVMAGALPERAGTAAVEALFRANGWGGTWHGSVFAYHHFHPDAHEALGCVSGRAELILGGPSGARLRVAAGDVIVLPAGTGHCFAESDGDFSVCGAYPPGQERFTTLRADRAEPSGADAAEAIRAVPRPETDPVFGARGPLCAAWG